MKITILVGFLFISGIFGCSSNSPEDLKVLGTNSFSKDAWADAPQEERGKMVFSLLHKYKVTKMNVEDIQSLLGKSTAYYEYDEFPAYLVGPKNIESEYGSGYMLAFPFNRKTGIIRKYLILPKPKKTI